MTCQRRWWLASTLICQPLIKMQWPLGHHIIYIMLLLRPGGICCIPQITPSLNTASMMAIRKQMDESNLEMVNTLTQ